jgi:threonine dehydrogenase-like Zn-dependent dehydrogenase
MRVRGLRTVVVGREASTDLRAQIAQQLGAEYLSAADRSLADIVREIWEPDLVLEATGSSQVVFDAMQLLNRNGVLCLLSVTSGDRTLPVPANLINQHLVLGNQVIFGSVNANPRHFAMGVKDLAAVEKTWPGVLRRMLTNAIPWQEHKTWFDSRGAGIKATLEISS